MLYKLYIGANNETGETEIKKAVKIISEYYEGFTIIKTSGYWQGKAENSFIVEINTDNTKAIGLLVIGLKEELKQEAIGVAEMKTEIEFI